MSSDQLFHGGSELITKLGRGRTSVIRIMACMPTWKWDLLPKKHARNVFHYFVLALHNFRWLSHLLPFNTLLCTEFCLPLWAEVVFKLHFPSILLSHLPSFWAFTVSLGSKKSVRVSKGKKRNHTHKTNRLYLQSKVLAVYSEGVLLWSKSPWVGWVACHFAECQAGRVCHWWVSIATGSPDDPLRQSRAQSFRQSEWFQGRACIRGL